MKYPFTVYQTQVEDQVFWVAECPLLDGCVGQGDSADEAVKELELNEDAWLETADKYGITIPEVPCEQMNLYSGKFTVRVAPHVHQTAVKLAKRQGISLNQYINDAIVAQNSSITSVSAILPAVSDAIKKVYYMMAFTTITKSTTHSYSTVDLSQDSQAQYNQTFAGCYR